MGERRGKMMLFRGITWRVRSVIVFDMWGNLCLILCELRYQCISKQLDDVLCYVELSSLCDFYYLPSIEMVILARV